MANPAWVDHETQGAQLPDKRLTQRLATVVSQLSRDPPNTIPACAADWRELIGCYRFFNNCRVTAEQILSGHHGATLARIRRQPMVLVVQDSTELCFERDVAVFEKGTVRGVTRQRVFCHLSAVFDEARTNLGVIGVDFWQRPGGGRRLRAPGSRVEALPLAAKESHRWVRHYEMACAVQAQCPDTTVLSVADCEADLHELFAYATHQPQARRADWLIRAKTTNRNVLGPDQELTPLWQDLLGSPIQGHLLVELPKRGHQAPRRAELAVRFKAIELTSSKNYAREAVTVYALSAQERHPPKGAKPIEWLLLTSLPVETLQHAHGLIGCYRNRWEIEIFFRVLKQQCRVEELKLQSFARLQKAVAVYLLVGWRIHNITMMSRRHPNANADVLYTASEWQTVYRLTEKRKPPRQAPPLREITGRIARLGGFIGRKGDGEPGVLNLCRGYIRLLHGIWIAETMKETAH